MTQQQFADERPDAMRSPHAASLAILGTHDALPSGAVAMVRIRVLVADAASLVLAGLRAVLSRAADLQVVGEAQHRASLAEQVERARPDVLVLGSGLPGVHELDIVADLVADLPTLRVIVLSSGRSEDAVRVAFERGAAGYVLLDDDAAELPAVVRMVHAGRFHLSAGASRVVVHSYAHRDGTPRRPLTRREREILALVATGTTSRDVGRQLGIALRTVHTHRAHIMRKLGVHTEAGLVHAAVRLGLCAT